MIHTEYILIREDDFPDIPCVKRTVNKKVYEEVKYANINLPSGRFSKLDPKGIELRQNNIRQ